MIKDRHHISAERERPASVRSGSLNQNPVYLFRVDSRRLVNNQIVIY